MRSLFVFEGKGKCEGSTAHVLGESETEARARLLRDDACMYFDIKGTLPFLTGLPSSNTDGEKR